MRRSAHFILAASILLLCSPHAGAQSIVLQGGAVNMGSAGYNSDVTTLPTGEFVVVWGDYSGYVLGSKVTGGTPGADFTVSTYSYSTNNVNVDSDDSGNFWVAWSEFLNSRARGFNSATTPLQPQFAIGGLSASNPQIGVRRSAGGFVAMYDQSFSGKSAQGFDGTGTQSFAPTPVPNYANARLAVDPVGNFMVVWSGDYLEAATFDTGGNPIPGGSFTIASPPSSYFDVAALSTGNFVVTWTEAPYVKAQLATTTGTSGLPIDVTSGIAGAAPAVSGNNTNFVVVWAEGSFVGKQRGAPTGDALARAPLASGDITAQAFSNSGTALGGPVLMNPSNFSYGAASVSMNGNDQFTVLWNGSSTYAQAAAICPNPLAPTLSAPANGSFLSAGSPVNFSWSADINADSYDVSISVDAGTPTIVNTLTNSLSQSLPPGSITWSVVSNYLSCPSSASSATGSFTLCPVVAEPTRILPADGSTFTAGSPVSFEWGAVTNAVDYDVFIKVDGGTPSVLGNTSGTTLSQTVPTGSIEWWVIANFASGCPSSGVPVTPGFFTVCPVLSPPTLLSPSSGASVVSPVTFQWSAVTGATSYELFVGVGTSPTLAGTTSGTSLSVALPDGTGDWFVVAKAGASCPTASSTTGIFTVTTPFICPTPSTPTLLAPDDGAEFEAGTLVTYQWSAAPGAVKYEVRASLNGAPPVFIGATGGSTSLARAIAEGTSEWFVIAFFGPGCETATTETRTVSTITVEPPPPPTCGLDEAPLPSIVGEATTGESYTFSWEALDGVSKYHIQESSNASFIGSIIQELTVEGLSATFSHPGLTTPTPFFYRVAGIPACNENIKGPYSKIVRVVGLPKPVPSSTNPQVVSEFGNDDFVETFLFIPGFGESSKATTVATFTASSNEPWLSVSPASGNLPPDGVTVQLLANPTGIDLGANTATITVTRDDGLGKTSSGSTTSGVPVTVSLVTPVTPIGKTSGPPQNALIIPAVANVTGLNTKWFSDVKITNRAKQVINYELNFSATDQSGFVDGKRTKITIRPGQTVAMDDVVRQWYGFGDLADGTNGALEIRPINFTGKSGTEAAPALATVASSRTYTRNDNSLASFGQFIPAIPFSSFLKAGVQDSLLMMQQISQTESLRSNFGLVEGAGKDVNVLLTAYDRQGTVLGEFPVSLKAGEHKQLNSFLALNGITVQDGRMSVRIASGEGAVTSYASVVSTGTGDPSLVPGIDPKTISASRFVLPGVADLRAGSANWRSDVRIFNPNEGSETVNLLFYPQGETTPLGPVEIVIQPGQIEVLPGVVESLFGRQDLGGALHIVTADGEATSLVVTGETYDVNELGKYGQFISGVTEENAIGVGSPGLEIMQVEESAQFRTNLGIAEVTGQPVNVQVQLTVPNSLIAPTRIVTLGGNEFQQLNGVVRQMTGGRDVYNGRLTVRVTGGSGKITAYGSTVDNQTRDATFSPGQ
jgi:hypothetical protein